MIISTMTSLHYALLYGALCLAQWGANVRAWRWAEGRRDRDGEPPADGAHPLERTVFETVRRHPQVMVPSLKRELERSEPIERMVSELRRQELLIESRKIAWVRLLWLAGPLLLVALGSARLATAWDYYGDQWMRVLLIAVLWTAAVAIFHVVEQVAFDGRPLPTACGRAALEARDTRDSTAGERDPDTLLALAVARGGESGCGGSTRISRRRSVPRAKMPQ